MSKRVDNALRLLVVFGLFLLPQALKIDVIEGGNEVVLSGKDVRKETKLGWFELIRYEQKLLLPCFELLSITIFVLFRLEFLPYISFVISWMLRKKMGFGKMEFIGL